VGYHRIGDFFEAGDIGALHEVNMLAAGDSTSSAQRSRIPFLYR
jgi:hypothetical protein